MNISTVLLTILIIEVSYLLYKTIRPNGIKYSQSPVFLDTSALMDGRIVTAAQTGFSPEHLVIPTSVVAELQMLADQADADKRSRARRGLDAIKELQQVESIVVRILDDGPTDKDGVDGRLVELARKHKGAICTIDFNLNKVASVHGIRVLNINELAGSIRMAFLPGETINLELTQKGQSSSQAVGYLADGTMVVVDNAASQMGQTVKIEFIRSLQTAAGRMMFAKLVKQDGSQTQSRTDKKIVNKSSPSQAESKGRKPAPATQQSTPSARTRRVKSKEDSLIELVNNQ